MAVLLALMIAHRSEDAQLYLGSFSGLKEVKLKSDVLLENVPHVMEQMEVKLILMQLLFAPAAAGPLWCSVNVSWRCTPTSCTYLVFLLFLSSPSLTAGPG